MATLRANLNLTPADAAAFFAAKGNLASFDYTDVWREANVHAFTVAKATSADVLRTIREQVEIAIGPGQTFEQFKKNLRPRLQELGWWGRQEVLDGDTGEVSTVQLGSTRRLRTIYQTNVQTAYMTGRYKRYLANVDERPFWRYLAIMDGRTRPAHAALNGKVYRWDDPVWAVIWPPNGWGCRCRIVALTEAEFKALKQPLSVGRDAVRQTEVVVNKAGDKKPLQVVDYLDGTGKKMTFRPDPGWDYNPGAEWLRAQNTAQVLATKVAAVPVAQGVKVAADVQRNAAALRVLDDAWRGWVSGLIDSPQPQRRTMMVGFLRAQDVAAIEARGGTVENIVIGVEDSRVVGRKQQRHVDAGDALSDDDWLNLSVDIRRPLATLWDTVNRTLIYVLADSQDRGKRVVVAPEYRVKFKQRQASLRTAYKSLFDDLAAQVKGGKLELLEGELGE